MTVIHALAKYLTEEDAQLVRFNEDFQNVPTNVEAQNHEYIEKHEAVVAFFNQIQYSQPQGRYPDHWWDYMRNLTDGIESLTDQQLSERLAQYQSNVSSLIK